MIEHQKPLNLLKELRNEIDTAMSAYSEQEDKDKHERMVHLPITSLIFCFKKYFVKLNEMKFKNEKCVLVFIIRC